MTSQLLETLGLYGATMVIAFVAGMFPLVSIEVFLVGLTALHPVTYGQLAVLVLIAAFGHQIAKTLCYFAGVGALEHGRVKPWVDRTRARIERWNKRRYTIFVLSTTVGFPPMYMIGFIARPLMNLPFIPFTVICFAGRVARYATLAVIPLLA